MSEQVSESDLDALDDAVWGPVEGRGRVEAREVGKAAEDPGATAKGEAVSEADLDALDDAVFGVLEEGSGGVGA